jgi:hypothetical protein
VAIIVNRRGVVRLFLAAEVNQSAVADGSKKLGGVSPRTGVNNFVARERRRQG